MLCSNCIKNDVCSIYGLIQKIQLQGVKLNVYLCQHSFNTLDNLSNRKLPETKNPEEINELSRRIHELTDDGKEESFRSSQGFNFTVDES